jgi:hypothetical protein
MSSTSTTGGNTTGGNTTGTTGGTSSSGSNTTGGTGGSVTRTIIDSVAPVKPDPKTPEGRYELYRVLHEKPGGAVPSDLVLRIKPEKTMRQRIEELEKKLAEMEGEIAGMDGQIVDGFKIVVERKKDL